MKQTPSFSNPVAYFEMVALINPRGRNEVPDKGSQIDFVSDTRLQGVA